MIKNILFFSILSLIVSCINDSQKIEFNHLENNLTETINIRKTDSIVSLESLSRPSDTIKENIPQTKITNKINNPKYPILMVVYNGCAGSTTYKYNKRKYKIEILSEFSDCPDNPNNPSPKGTYLARLPNYLSVCYKNYLIKKMQNYKSNYLTLYNKQFHTNLKVEKQYLNIKYPLIFVSKDNMGGGVSYTFDTTSNTLKKDWTMHNHSENQDPNDCIHGKFVSKLPNTLSDSTKNIIIDLIKIEVPTYENIYFKKYGDSIITR